MTLTLPGGITVHPKTLPGGPDPQSLADTQDAQSALFPFQYAFAVPDTITSATLTIDVPAMPAVAAYTGDNPITVTPGTATFAFSVPAPASPTPPAGAATAPADIVVSHFSGATSAHGGDSGLPTGPLIGGLLGLVAVIAAGTFVVTRRRRMVPTPSLAGPGPATTPLSGSHPPPPSPPLRRQDEPVVPADPPNPDLVPPSSPPSPAATEPRPLLVPPSGLPPLAAGQIRVLVFGQPTIEGLPVPLGQTQQELLTWLVLHPGLRFTAEQLRGHLSSPGRHRDVSADTIRSYIGDLRKVCGEAHIPTTRAGGAYEAIGIDSDATSFHDATRRATAPDVDPPGRATYLAEALAWVRGAPFSHVDKGTYGWADTNLDLAAYTPAIVDAALTLARLANDHGDVALARWAVGQGLQVAPTDQRLDEPRLIAEATAGPAQLDATWRQILARLAGHSETPNDRLLELYRSLRDDQPQ